MSGFESLFEEHRELRALAEKLKRCAADRGKGLEEAAREFYHEFQQHAVREEKTLYKELWRLPELRSHLESFLQQHKRIIELSYQLKAAHDKVAEDPQRLEHIGLNIVQHAVDHFDAEERVLLPRTGRP